MSFLEQTGTRESEDQDANEYDRVLAARDDLDSLSEKFPVVIDGSQIEYELCRQGRVKWYLNEYTRETLASGWMYFLREFSTYTGRHTHQGGLYLYILSGKGHTVVDGHRIDWKANDFVMLPIKPNGVEHQHFNDNPDGTSVFLAAYYLPMWNELAGRFVQNAEDPEWLERNQA